MEYGQNTVNTIISRTSNPVITSDAGSCAWAEAEVEVSSPMVVEAWQDLLSSLAEADALQ
jgi:hypothetical protein